MSYNLLQRNCDFSLPLKDAYVIISIQDSGCLKVRAAKDLEVSRTRIVELIDEQVLIADPKQNSSKNCKVIFYGSKAACKETLDSQKDKGLRSPLGSEHADDGSTNSDDDCRRNNVRKSNRILSSSGASKVTRSNNNSNTQEFASILNSIRDEQLALRKSVDELTRDSEMMLAKLDEVISKKTNERKRLTYSESAEVLQHCTTEIARIRIENKTFEDKLKRIDWEFVNVTPKQKEDILSELRFERRVTKLVSRVGKIIYGPLLLTHILGRNGRRERSRRETERPDTFSLGQENRLREILRVFGDLFTTDKIWKSVVQHSINQTGRDVKKNRKRTIEDEDTIDDDSEHENKKTRQDLNKSSAEVLPDINLDDLAGLTD